MDDLLEAASQRPLTLVVAGPGWGKTTAVAGWARRRSEDSQTLTAWLTLTSGDDSPTAFWTSVLAAIADSGAVPDRHPLSRVSAAGGITEEVRLALLRGMSLLPAPIVLVLDDFQVIDDPGVMSALTDVVTFQSQVRLLLVTRHDPPMPLHRMRVSGALAEVRAGDLAFDAAATRRLAIDTESLDLSVEELHEVLARTEGWPTGVRLATMHLSRTREGRDVASFGGSDRSVAEFLAAEVIEHHTTDMRDFLRRTSVAETITAGLADVIVPGGMGGERLDALERANQFVTATDSGRTTFRYHPLLRDLLVHTLLRDDPEGFRAAHRDAARWLAAHGDPIRALGHSIAAEDWGLAAELFIQASPSVVGVHATQIRRHLEAIPFEKLTSTPRLELAAAGLAFLSGRFDVLGSHVARARHLVDVGGDVDPVSMTLLENLACADARARGDQELAAVAASAALRHVSRAHSGQAADGLRVIAMNQSAALLFRAGRVAESRRLLATVEREGSPSDLGLTVLMARGHIACCDLYDGELLRASTSAQAVLEDASSRGWASQLQLQFAYLPVAVTELLWGNLEAADRAVTAGLAADTNGVEVWPTVALRLTQASIAAARGRPRAASAALASAREGMVAMGSSPSLAAMHIRAETDVALLTNTGAEGAAPEDDDSATALSARARLLLRRGHLEEAVGAAQQSLGDTAPEGLDALLAAIEAWLVVACVSRSARTLRVGHYGRRAGRRACCGTGDRRAVPIHRLRPSSDDRPRGADHGR